MVSFNKAKSVVILGTVIFFLACFLFGFNYTNFEKDKQEQLKEETTYFKEFTLTDINGNEFTQDDLKNYKIIMVNGWGPWCAHCVEEMPALEKLSAEYESKGLLIIGVVADYYVQTQKDSTYNSQVLDTVAKCGVTYPCLLGDERFYSEVVPMMMNAYPGSWFVDQEGNIVKFVAGSNSEDGWREIFDSLLEEADKQ